jgi:hypothetical protein
MTVIWMGACYQPTSSHPPIIITPPTFADSYIVPSGAFDGEHVCAESRVLGMRTLCMTVGEFRSYLAGRLSAE